MSSFQERRYSWERRIEDIIIEMSKEKTVNGLAIHLDHRGLASDLKNMIDGIEAARNQSKQNPGMARIIPSDRLNEE